MKFSKVSFDLKRFSGIKRDYSKEDVEKLKGTFNIEYTLCKSQSEKLWNLLNTEPYVKTLGSLSGNQAVQHAKAGLKAIYLSGWQVAADANSAGEMYPDQSLYPYDSAPKLVEAMNNALIRADQIQHMEITEKKINIKDQIDYKMPIIADGEKYVCIARTVEKGIAKHGMFKSLLSIGLGCQIKYAKDFVYTDALNLNDKNTEVPIGVNCRTCDRMDCQQRAFPPLHKKFDIDLNKRGISVYVAD